MEGTDNAASEDERITILVPSMLDDIRTRTQEVVREVSIGRISVRVIALVVSMVLIAFILVLSPKVSLWLP